MKPLNFDATKTYPLILSLHGAGGRGTGNIKTLRNWNEYLADAPDLGYITQYASDRADKTPDAWDWLFKQTLSQRK